MSEAKIITSLSLYQDTAELARKARKSRRKGSEEVAEHIEACAATLLERLRAECADHSGHLSADPCRCESCVTVRGVSATVP